MAKNCDVNEARPENLTETQWKELPDFGTWFDETISTRSEYHHIRADLMYFACQSTIRMYTMDIRRVSAAGGEYDADSKEFEQLQAAWWQLWRKIQCLRRTLCEVYQVQPPAKTAVRHDRYEYGLLLHKADIERFKALSEEENRKKFEAFMVEPSVAKDKAGVITLKAESEESYMEEMRANTSIKGELKKEIEKIYDTESHEWTEETKKNVEKLFSNEDELVKAFQDIEC